VKPRSDSPESPGAAPVLSGDLSNDIQNALVARLRLRRRVILLHQNAAAPPMKHPIFLDCRKSPMCISRRTLFWPTFQDLSLRPAFERLQDMVA
jgi:hypothetical protein